MLAFLRVFLFYSLSSQTPVKQQENDNQVSIQLLPE